MGQRSVCHSPGSCLLVSGTWLNTSPPPPASLTSRVQYLLLPDLSRCYLACSLLFFSLFTGRMALVALELLAKHRRSLHPSSVLSRDPLPDWIYLISISIAFFVSLTKYQTRSNFRREECILLCSRGCIPSWQARHGRKRRGMAGHTVSTARKQGANRKCG